ncbi:MAG: CidA/LrgA family protein [Bacillota bacterium]|nr:CidA/LrgA family protein [Bacillota bacterium]
MKLLRQFGILLVICYIGEFLKEAFKLPLPGNIIGMIILFLLLSAGIVKLEMLKEVSSFLLEHLAFFFVPAGVGLIAYMDVLGANWVTILGISLITTILVAGVTGKAIELMMRGVKK